MAAPTTSHAFPDAPRPWSSGLQLRHGVRPLPGSLVILVLGALGGCSGADGSRAVQGFGAGAAFESAAGGRATSGKYLQASLHGVESVLRLAPSAFEERRAAAGNTLLVLDVSVLNRDTQPRVFSEGKLIAVSGGREHAIAVPLDMLSDGFLSLQVLEPSVRVRGKIVYEVPQRLDGRLYWVPGEGGARIALEGLDLSRSSSNAASADARHVAGSARPAAVPPPAATGAAAIVVPTAATSQGGEPAAPSAGARQAHAAPATAKAVWSGAGRWPPREGPAFECANAWKRVEHIICSDETLASMDWELNRAYAIARSSVQDRDALQRQESAWRFGVRDECPTRDCVEAVYERRIGELYAMARK